MAVTLSYVDDLSRVRVVCSGIIGSIDFAKIERSPNGIVWETCRGGDAVPVSGGSCSLDDYEFDPDVTNYYRATYTDTATPSWVGSGSFAVSNNAPVTPTLPAAALGDTLILFVASNNTAVTFNTPAGWTNLTHLGSFRVYSRTFIPGGSVTAPTITPSGGSSGDDIMARIVSFRNVVSPVWTTRIDPTVAQNVTTEAIGVPNPQSLLALFILKRSVATAAARSGFGSMYASSGTASSISGLCTISAVDIPVGVTTMTGGAPATSVSATMRFDKAPWVYAEQATIVPPMGRVWLKCPQYPHLNRPVTVVDWSDIERPDRSAVNEVIGRTLPVAITDVRGSRRYSIFVTTWSLGNAQEFSDALSTGFPWLLHTPPDCPFPGMYAIIRTTLQKRGSASVRSPRRIFELPLIEVAAPVSTLVASTVMWSDVVNTYATWADVIAAEPTWSDVLATVGSPSDIIVP